MNSLSLKRVARDYAISIAFWLTLSVMLSWQEYVWAHRENFHTSFSVLTVLFGIRFLTVAVLTPPIFYLIERCPLQAKGAAYRALIYLLGYVPFTFLFACIRWTLHTPWLPETQDWGHRTFHSLFELAFEGFADQFAIYLGIVIAGHAYYYFSRLQREEHERMELQQALMQSELSMLKSQMHPHFLFNTLHGITALVSVDPNLAEDMLRGLSRLLRASLKERDTDLVTLGEDLKFAEDYIAIEKMRLVNRLRVDWKIGAGTRQLLIPPLIIQPLLENSIKHGIAPSRKEGWIEVSTQVANGTLVLSVRNSVGVHSVPGTGVGHKSIRSRLMHLFASDASFSFHRGQGFAQAIVTLPVLQDDAHTENSEDGLYASTGS